MKYTLTVNIEGMTLTDLEAALDEVKSAVEGGYREGKNSNSSGDYYFEVEEDDTQDYYTRYDVVEKMLDKWEEEEDEDDPLNREATQKIWEAKSDEEIIEVWRGEFDRELEIIEE